VLEFHVFAVVASSRSTRTAPVFCSRNDTTAVVCRRPAAKQLAELSSETATGETVQVEVQVVQVCSLQECLDSTDTTVKHSGIRYAFLSFDVSNLPKTLHMELVQFLHMSPVRQYR